MPDRDPTPPRPNTQVNMHITLSPEMAERVRRINGVDIPGLREKMRTEPRPPLRFPDYAPREFPVSDHIKVKVDIQDLPPQSTKESLPQNVVVTRNYVSAVGNALGAVGAAAGSIYTADKTVEAATSGKPVDTFVGGTIGTAATGTLAGGSAVLAGNAVADLGYVAAGAKVAAGGVVVAKASAVLSTGIAAYGAVRGIDYATGNRVTKTLAVGGCALYDTVAASWRWATRDKAFDYSMTSAAYNARRPNNFVFGHESNQEK